MKAITISQPYASLIADGEKWVENRTWPTRYRGPLAIHAGKGKQYLTKAELETYPTGCVIAVCVLVDCVWVVDFGQMCDEGLGRLFVHKNSTRRFHELRDHEHAEGPWCWILENVRKIDPVPINGKQGLWEFRPEKIHMV